MKKEILIFVMGGMILHFLHLNPLPSLQIEICDILAIILIFIFCFMATPESVTGYCLLVLCTEIASDSLGEP